MMPAILPLSFTDRPLGLETLQISHFTRLIPLPSRRRRMRFSGAFTPPNPVSLRYLTNAASLKIFSTSIPPWQILLRTWLRFRTFFRRNRKALLNNLLTDCAGFLQKNKAPVLYIEQRKKARL